LKKLFFRKLQKAPRVSEFFGKRFFKPFFRNDENGKKAEKAREIIFFVFVLYPVHSKILRRAVRAATSSGQLFQTVF